LTKFVPISEQKLVEWTQRFVRHPSEQTDKMEGDPAILSFVTDSARPILEDAGLNTRIDSFGNLLCEAGPPDAEMPMLLLAYAMTHPRNRMQQAFEGEVLDAPEGKVIRGRGVSEQKSAMAASLAAFLDVATSGRLKQRIGWALLTAGETGRHDAVAVALKELGVKPKFSLLAIGTATKIALGNRGRIDIEVQIRGKSSHSSTPWAGVDVTRGIRELLTRAEAIGAKLPSHPDLGPATLTCTSIKTGPDATHTVQSEARMVFDRRLMPGEEPEVVLEGLRAAFALEPPLTCTVSRGPFMYGSAVAKDSPFMTEIAAALSADKLAMPNTFYSPGSLDAGYLIQHGTVALKWGPGDPAQFHTDEERVPVADVVLMAQRYKAVLNHLAC
jgi:acetylornithine deacetylase